MGEIKNTYANFIGKPEGKKVLTRPKHRWEVNIKIDLRKYGENLCPGSVAGCCEHGNVPSGSV
jgi:hypothetical protein